MNSFSSMVKNAVKWVLPFCLLAFLPVSVSAQGEAPAVQTLKYGYLSYEAVLHGMADYAVVESSIGQLRSQYEAEQKRVEKEFNEKYEEFLEGQRDFPQTILQKRQSELQQLLDRNVAFKKESQRLLAEALADAEAPLRNRLQKALDEVGSQKGLAFIVNTDQQPLTWINPQMGEDVTEAVRAALK